MKRYIQLLFLATLSFFVLMCNKKDSVERPEETMLEGNTSILVDETLMPVIEDQVAVFESEYVAKIKLIPKSEAEALQALFKDSSAIIVMARQLSGNEQKAFQVKKITPRVTRFATDAIALIGNKNDNDSLVALQDVLDFMKGKKSKIKGLVFDNPNSSTVSYLNKLAGLESIPEKGVYSVKTNVEVIKFVAENRGMIGVTGINWLAQPSEIVKNNLDKITILSVKGLTGDNYYYPSQNDLAEGKYPLARDLYVVNGQGFAGLGMGFSSFITSERGQRIILKSGLLPVKTPGRKVRFRNVEKKQ